MGPRIRVTTTFDCTTTGIIGSYKNGDRQQWKKSRDQQRNFETLTQLIGLYTQPLNLTAAKLDTKTKTWSFEFESEFHDVFKTDNDDLGMLKTACDNIPMITGLDETADHDPVLKPDQNIWFGLVE